MIWTSMLSVATNKFFFKFVVRCTMQHNHKQHRHLALDIATHPNGAELMDPNSFGLICLLVCQGAHHNNPGGSRCNELVLRESESESEEHIITGPI